MSSKGRTRGRKTAAPSTTSELTETTQKESISSIVKPIEKEKKSKRRQATEQNSLKEVQDAVVPIKRLRAGQKEKEKEKEPTKEISQQNGTSASVSAEEQQPKVVAKRGRAKPSKEKESQDNEEQPIPAKKELSGSKRGKRAASIAASDAIAEKKEKPSTSTVKTAAAKKIVEEKKGRKRTTPQPTIADVKATENGDDQEVEENSVPVAKKETGRGRKRPAAKSEPTKNEASKTSQKENAEIADDQAQSKTKTTKAKAPRANEINTKYDKMNFDLDKEYNYKISSWNVAGIRSWITKGGLEYVEKEKPDILCLQEIKCDPEKLPDEARIPGYHPYWCGNGGYAGVALYSKIMPIHVEYGIGDEEQDKDGRIMTAEYEKFYLVVVYVPNAGQKLVTLPKRMRWDQIFHDYLTKLNEKKPVIITGDMNVAHNEIDLTNPKTNKNNAGFTKEEREGMTKLLSLGFVDTFRHFYPDKEKVYTFWSFRGGARAKNVGWRLDYFIVSERFLPKVVDNVVRSEVLGSDHCPLTLFLKL